MNGERKILIIEDNADDQALLMRQLKKANFDKHVKFINDGGQALAYLCDPANSVEELTAIFLYLKLPTHDGLKILQAMKKSKRLRHIAVVVMTSSNDPRDLEQCRKLAVSTFVKKPLTFSSFVKVVADNFQTLHSSEFTVEKQVLSE